MATTKKNVKDQIELTETEKSLVKDLNLKKTKLTEEIGYIAQQKLVLNYRQKRAEEFYEQIVEQENQIAKNFTEKYGIGSVDIETGIFTPGK